mgnify:CR=1 FL=1
MRVFIYAYEQNYGGLHGIHDMRVCDIDSLDEINEIGLDMALEVIDSYSNLFESEYDDEDYEDPTNFCCWEAYKIKDDIDLSVDELDNICNKLGDELFIKRYCDKYKKIL